MPVAEFYLGVVIHDWARWSVEPGVRGDSRAEILLWTNDLEKNDRCGLTTIPDKHDLNVVIMQAGSMQGGKV